LPPFPSNFRPRASGKTAASRIESTSLPAPPITWTRAPATIVPANSEELALSGSAPGVPTLRITDPSAADTVDLLTVFGSAALAACRLIPSPAINVILPLVV